MGSDQSETQKGAVLQITLPNAPVPIDEFHVVGTQEELEGLAEDIRRRGYLADLRSDLSDITPLRPEDLRQHLRWLFED
jgi:hypothetical protein